MQPPKDIRTIPIDDPRLDWHFYVLFQMDVKKFGTIAKLIRGIQDTFEGDKGYVSAAEAAAHVTGD